ncbi:MAG: antibiotic biosynthesis monooxygenase family protein [Sphingomicrobium sp.]
MTHLRLWRFEVSPKSEQQFVAAYGSEGDWARLFAAAPGFIRTELWRNGDGIYLTADFWNSFEAFERIQASQGEAYRRLDAELEELTLTEDFLGAFDLVD